MWSNTSVSSRGRTSDERGCALASRRTAVASATLLHAMPSPAIRHGSSPPWRSLAGLLLVSAVLAQAPPGRAGGRAVIVEPSPLEPAIGMQDADGHWGGGEAGTDLRVTAWMLLAALADGSTLRSGPERENLKRGMRWLRRQQDGAGRFALRSDPEWLLDHAMATLAMAEAMQRSRQRSLGPDLERAIAALRRGVANMRPVADAELRLWCELVVRTARRCEVRLLTAAMIEPPLPATMQRRWVPGGFDAVDLGAATLSATLADLPAEVPSLAPCARRDAAQYLRDVLAGRIADGEDLPAVWNADLMVEPLATWYVLLAQWHRGPVGWRRAALGIGAAMRQPLPGVGGGGREGAGAFGREHGRFGSAAVTALCSTLYYRYCKLAIAE